MQIFLPNPISNGMGLAVAMQPTSFSYFSLKTLTFFALTQVNFSVSIYLLLQTIIWHQTAVDEPIKFKFFVYIAGKVVIPEIIVACCI